MEVIKRHHLNHSFSVLWWFVIGVQLFGLQPVPLHNGLPRLRDHVLPLFGLGCSGTVLAYTTENCMSVRVGVYCNNIHLFLEWYIFNEIDGSLSGTLKECFSFLAFSVWIIAPEQLQLHFSSLITFLCLNAQFARKYLFRFFSFSCCLPVITSRVQNFIFPADVSNFLMKYGMQVFHCCSGFLCNTCKYLKTRIIFFFFPFFFSFYRSHLRLDFLTTIFFAVLILLFTLFVY